MRLSRTSQPRSSRGVRRPLPISDGAPVARWKRTAVLFCALIFSGQEKALAQQLDPGPGALHALAAASARPLQGTAGQGAVRLVQLDAPAPGSGPADQAALFMATYGAVFGQSGAGQGLALRSIRREGPDGQLQLASFAQTYKGIPVFGADASVGIESSPLTGASRVVFASAALIPDPGLGGGLGTTPALAPETCVTP